MIDIAVIMVTWNNADDIVAALQSLIDDLDNSTLQSEIWLVDSASTDNTVTIVRQQFPQVKLITSPKNIGFAAANNLALRQLGFDNGAKQKDLPQAVYLLNPDTATHPGATKLLYEALNSSEDVGVVGARLTFGDGSFQHSAFRFPGLRQLLPEFFPLPGRLVESSFNGRYPRQKYQGTEPFDVDFTLGATMMIKGEVIAQSGVFDERFFIYCEEVDWAWRIKELGWRILCVPSAHVTHFGGQSTSQVRPSSLVHLWKSRLLLYDKHYPSWKHRIACQLVILGMRRQLQGSDSAEEELQRARRTIIDMARSWRTSQP